MVSGLRKMPQSDSLNWVRMELCVEMQRLGGLF